MQKNDVLDIRIDSLSSEGVGVGRQGASGLVVFVDGALPEEMVRCKVIKLKKGYAIARLEEIIQPSPERIEPPCPYYRRCGGCSLQHMSYPAQLEYKRSRAEECLRRIGRFENIAVSAIHASDDEFRYRNKATFPIAPDGDGIVTGPFEKRSHRVVDVEDCLIQQHGTAEAIAAVRRYAKAFGIPAYDERSKTGILRHMVYRKTSLGRATLTLVCNSMPEADMADISRHVTSYLPDADGVVVNINSKDTNVIFGDEFYVHGSMKIPEEIAGIRLELSPASFMQVNHGQCGRLYMKALEMAALTGDERVIDAYCGIGSMSLLFAGHARHVYGIECVEQAVSDARHNAIINKMDNCEFIYGLAEDIIPELVHEGAQPDVLLLDPPRKGCHENVLNSAIHAGIPRIVYISCNPATLARDAAMLRDGGYRLDIVEAFDMFPQTVHVECAALFIRG